MFSGLLQDWTTLDGAGTEASVQGRAAWLDLPAFGDVTFWLEVRAVTNPGAGNVTLTYETSPSVDDSLFQPLATLTMAASSGPVISRIELASNPTIPLGRFVRWKVAGTQAGSWSATFRIFAMANKGSAGGFDPATLSLSGWWRADYSGSPWDPTASAGGSAGNGSLTEATNPPTTGTAQNGRTPADFDGVATILTAANNNTTYFGTSGSIWYVFYATAAPTALGTYQDGTVFSDNANAETTFGFTSAGIGGCILDDTVTYQSISVACGTNAWHLAQFKWDGSNIYARVDSGSWSSAASGPYTSATPSAPTIGRSYANLRFTGQLLEVGTAASALSDADFDNIKSYVNSRYGLAL